VVFDSTAERHALCRYVWPSELDLITKTTDFPTPGTAGRAGTGTVTSTRRSHVAALDNGHNHLHAPICPWPDMSARA